MRQWHFEIQNTISLGKRGKKSALNHPTKPLHPRANVGKKVPQTMLASFYTPPPPLRAMPIWKQQIRQGFKNTNSKCPAP